MNHNTLLIWSRMGDYHRARWRALEAVSPGRIIAADLGAGDDLYKWESDNSLENYILLSKKSVNETDFFKRCRNFVSVITSNDISEVWIPGYGKFEYVFFLIYSKLAGKKTYLFAESWYGSNTIINWLKGLFLNFCCSGFLVSGQRAFDHFNLKLGISKEKIRMGYSVVDNEHFESVQVEKSSEKKILLCVARYSPEKNIVNLVKAFKTSTISKDWELQLVGAGPLKHTIEFLSEDFENVKVCEWTTYDELPKLYKMATAFILPSVFEPWGLVVNEAMASGLPVFVSEECGCVPDLFIDMENCVIKNSSTLDGLCLALDSISKLSDEALGSLSAQSKENIKKFTPQTWAAQVMKFSN